jgi:transglutaminase-like putative cysteine protease
VFDYVRSQVRYVGLEFGIHSLKPHAAREVAQRQFGDCKDKATLLVAMLAELGIAAEVALVRTRDEGPLADGIASLGVFNHAIVHVPTLGWWLDPTAVAHAANELPVGDGGGFALPIRADTSTRLEQLPAPALAEQLDEREVTLMLSSQGGATVQWTQRLRGLAAADLRTRLLAAATPREAIEQELGSLWPSAELRSLQLEGVHPIADEVVVRAQAVVPRIGQRQGQRWQLAPWRTMVPAPGALRHPGPRQADVALPRPLRVTVRTTLVAPRGWQLVQSPRPTTLAAKAAGAQFALAQTAASQWQLQLLWGGDGWRAADHEAVYQWWVQVDSALRSELVLETAGGL